MFDSSQSIASFDPDIWDAIQEENKLCECPVCREEKRDGNIYETPTSYVCNERALDPDRRRHCGGARRWQAHHRFLPGCDPRVLNQGAVLASLGERPRIR